MSIKFINAKQAIDIHAYKNTNRKLHKTNAAIWFNKTCRDKELTPNYIKIINSIIKLHLVGISTELIHRFFKNVVSTTRSSCISVYKTRT